MIHNHFKTFFLFVKDFTTLTIRTISLGFLKHLLNDFKPYLAALQHQITTCLFYMRRQQNNKNKNTSSKRNERDQWQNIE